VTDSNAHAHSSLAPCALARSGGAACAIEFTVELQVSACISMFESHICLYKCNIKIGEGEWAYTTHTHGGSEADWRCSEADCGGLYNGLYK